MSGVFSYQPLDNGNSNPTWIDLLVHSNPQGVMQVLSRYGYSGYLAPHDEQELIDAAADLVYKRGEEAVVELLKAHPLYDVINDLTQINNQKVYRSATGDQSTGNTTLAGMDYKKLALNALVVIGLVYVLDKFWEYFSK
jgi:hypothetical protein